LRHQSTVQEPEHRLELGEVRVNPHHHKLIWLATILLSVVLLSVQIAAGHVSLLLFDGSLQTLTAVRSERLERIVVRYDAGMNLRTSQADFVVKLKASDGKKYIRLRYSPHGFGFDAPPAKSEQLAPKEMFADGSVVWIFRAHSPRNPEEQSACTGQVKRYAHGKDSRLVEVERFASVPVHESEIIPKPESLSCLIMGNWELKEK
jgi:hypothetical protein